MRRPKPRKNETCSVVSRNFLEELKGVILSEAKELLFVAIRFEDGRKRMGRVRHPARPNRYFAAGAGGALTASMSMVIEISSPTTALPSTTRL